MGKQHGGYLALRALQLQPDKFRCAIALDSILDIESWIAETRWTNSDSGPELVRTYLDAPERQKEPPLTQHPEMITKPVLLLNYRGDAGKAETTAYVKAKTLSLALQRNDVPVELYDLSEDYMANLPRAKAEVFRHIEDFLNVYIYEYKVKLGELKQIND
jgi:pimeloyl-ACP methyl ester carboxylesterase